MRRYFKILLFRNFLFLMVLMAGLVNLTSCQEDYILDEQEPEWLGASIYDYLVDQGNYTYYVQIVEDVGVKEVLQKTGSKTVFVANDEAFERFFQDNTWGVSSYGDLSETQKRLILNFGMVNNAYLIETLSNYYDGELSEGQSMRRETAISPLDTIFFEKDNLPNTQHWNDYKNRGIYLLKDNTNSPLVYFLQSQLTYAAITNDDFKKITGSEREEGDAHVFDKKVIKRDIVCKNGYVNILDDVLIPPVNMADYLASETRTDSFSIILERFSAPYYDGGNTNIYKQLHPGFTDSIYVKEYFAPEIMGGRERLPNNRLINTEYLLPFNPGWNSYRDVESGIPLQADMGAVFAPTNDAMNQYFNFGAGKILKDRFGSWNSVPDDIASLFLQRHLRTSLIASTPSRFYKMTDTENSPIYVDEEDIVDSYVGVNGVVYLTNNVYPPDDYVSVYGPVLFSEHTRVFNWAIRQNDFRLYLNSLISRYSFFVPTDEYFKNYIEPVAYGKNIKAALKFWYNDEDRTVNATVYEYDAANNIVGDSISFIEDEAFLSNRLLDMLNSHIVVNGVEDGDNFYLTKGGNAIKVRGSAGNMIIQGGGDIERENEVKVVDHFDVENGNTYFIDAPIQTPLNSVYGVLSDSANTEFSRFYDLLSGFPASSNYAFFVKKEGYYGVDFTVKFLNTYNYTIYVPTNEALNQAIRDSVILPWEDYVVTPGDTIKGINSISLVSERNAEMAKLERFLRYHFQDNSVFVGVDGADGVYQSSTIKLDGGYSLYNTYKNKYYKIGVNSDGNTLYLTTETESDKTVVSATVQTDGGLYNILVRDYIFNDNPLDFTEVNGTGSGTAYSDSEIFTSATAVIHQIDNVLKYEIDTNEN